MNRIVGTTIVLSALATLGVTEIAAQNVESIMRARERLELTVEQLESLEALRREAVQEQTAEMAELQELRSQLDAGQIQRSELMAFLEERREQRQALVEQRRERIEAVLTEDQLESLQQMRRRTGRMGVRPGGRPGMDGPGFAPRGRAGLRGLQRPRRGPPRAALRGFLPRRPFGR
jgi:TolA-binding protein